MLSRTRKVRKQRSRSRQTATETLEDRLLLTINFNFDYTYDTGNFFNTNAKKQVLELAGEIIGSQLEDNLDAINPSGSNDWRAIFPRPDNGNSVEVSNPSIAENELLVYVGARALDGPVGNGGFGGFWASGSSAFRNTVDFRGQSGESSGNDHGPWGGQLTFNTSTNYHFGETVEGLENDETDFLSVAVHEISHLLGFGLSDSFETHVTGSGKFNGPKAVAEYDGSGNVPLAGSESHIESSITDEGREAAMDPGVLRGERKLLTKLDWAVLADIGWEVDTSTTKDWGDAPNSSYPTRSSNNGARHTLGSGLELGVTADPDDDGQSGANSNGDDTDGFDDDDGVVFSEDYLQAGTTMSIDVTATASGGKLDAWIDFNGDGDWSDSGEQIFDTESLARGENRLTFDIPEDANEGTTYARFRLSSAGGLNFTGGADDGEVEDYRLTIIGEIAAMNDTFGSEGTLDVLDNDLPANQGKILSFDQPNEGTVTDNFDGTLDFDGGSGFSGSTSFSYTVGFEQDKGAGSSTSAGDEFGSAVAISGDFALVGSHAEDNNNGTDAGAAYLFERTGDREWTQIKKFTANDGVDRDRFGYSVAIDGSTLVIGARMADVNGTNDGAAYVFRKNEGGTDNWGLVQKIIGSGNSAKDQFGHSVAISGDTIAVGARLDDGFGTNSGTVYIFEKNLGGTNNWGEQKRLKSSDATGGDQFGFAVDIDGNNLLVGARKDDDKGTDSGSAYFYNRNEGGSENWGRFKKVSASDGAKFDWFGSAVALDGNYAVIGKPIRHNRTRAGMAYTYAKDGSNWTIQESFEAENPSDDDQFGYSVAIDGNTVVVGARESDVAKSNGGGFQVHTRNTGGTNRWGLDYEIFKDDANGGDYFGASVGISGDFVIAGAPLDDDDGSKSGTVSFQDIATTNNGNVTIALSSSGSGGNGNQGDDGSSNDGSSGSSSGSGGSSNLLGDDADEQEQRPQLTNLKFSRTRTGVSTGEGSRCCCDQCLATVSGHQTSMETPSELVSQVQTEVRSDLHFRNLDSLFGRLFRR